jgi:hypothetical protein
VIVPIGFVPPVKVAPALTGPLDPTLSASTTDGLAFPSITDVPGVLQGAEAAMLLASPE